MNYGALVGHDGVLGEYCFVAPGVHLVGAGAVVIRDVPDGETVVGVPARPIRRSAP